MKAWLWKIVRGLPEHTISVLVAHGVIQLCELIRPLLLS